MDLIARARRDGPSGDAIKRRPLGSEPSRYVVIAPQGLGDCLEATPMLAALRQASPSAHIETVVLRSTARDLFTQLPELVDQVTYLPYWELGPNAFLRAALHLPLGRRADVAFLTFPAARPVYAALLASVPARRRLSHRYKTGIVRAVFNPLIHCIPIGLHHNVHRNMDLLRCAGIDAAPPVRYVVPRAWGSHFEPDVRSVVIHVGSIAHHGLEAKRWPEDRFAELGRRLQSRGYTIKLLSGPAERRETARVAAAIPNVEIVEGSLEEATRILARAGCVIANDNGIAHVAAGLRRPVLALFGPTPVEFGPFAPEAVAYRPTTCPPCFDVLKTDASCKLGIDYACLKRDLTVDLVEARFVRMMATEGDVRIS